MSGGTLGRLARHPSLGWVRRLTGRGLEALGSRLAARVAPTVSEAMSDPASPILSQGSHLLGQMSMLTQHALGRLDRSLLLSGRIASLQVAALGNVAHLGDVEFRVCSQWGEDGIIEWLCHKLPGISRSFIEFGVENFGEANCRFLIENRGWRGLVMDGSESHMRNLRDEALYWRHDLTAVNAFITAENIDTLIMQHGFEGELGILSVDIDGNDYWVLEAITCVNPAVIICEINGVFGDLKPISVPYRPDFQRMDAHWSGQYFGCSLAAAQMSCRKRGYTYVGTNTNGVNAFFVRDDLAGPIVACLGEIRTWAPRHRDSRDRHGTLDFVRGLGRYDLIADMPVVDLSTGELVALRSLGPLYSERFLEDFR